MEIVRRSCTLDFPGHPTSRFARRPRQLAAQGFTEVRRVNFWTWPGEHKGIVSCWREPRSAVLLEVQFHTRPSYEAWQPTRHGVISSSFHTSATPVAQQRWQGLRSIQAI